jgi:tRNA1(Val) A37 N6-methylase TrmN6
MRTGSAKSFAAQGKPAKRRKNLPAARFQPAAAFLRGAFMSDSIEILDHGTQVFTTPRAGFGTDALLLARFVTPKPGQRAADLCSGCGIVALVWHDAGWRGPGIAVELDAQISAQCAASFAAQPVPSGSAASLPAPGICPPAIPAGSSAPPKVPTPAGTASGPSAPSVPAASLPAPGICPPSIPAGSSAPPKVPTPAAHLRAVCADVRRFALPKTDTASELGHYDVVACNPPYFTGGPRSADALRAQARHEDACTLADAAACAARLLKDGGRFALCQKPERFAETCAVLCAAHLEPKRVALVKNSGGGVPWLFLLEAQKNRRPGLRWLPDVTVSAGAALYGPDGPGGGGGPAR